MPKSVEDIISIGKSPLTREYIFETIQNPKAQEWRYKVGVVGIRDGSAKGTVRLLHSNSFVFKTDLAQASSNFGEAKSKVLEQIETENYLKLWHPEKRWFVYKTQEKFIQCSICPYLVTLRNLENFQDKLYWWQELLIKSCEVMMEYGISLDLSPANFGIDKGKKLYYIDEEVYKSADYQDMGTFIIQRFLEEPYTDIKNWENFILLLRKKLNHIGVTIMQINQICEGIMSYPINSNFYPERQILYKAMSKKI